MKKIFFVFFFALLLFVFVGCGGHNYDSYNYPMVVDPDALGESYLDITENPFVSAQEQSVSAFALDTSTAGYANIRRMSIKKNFLSLWKNIINDWNQPRAYSGVSF